MSRVWWYSIHLCCNFISRLESFDGHDSGAGRKEPTVPRCCRPSWGYSRQLHLSLFHSSHQNRRNRDHAGLGPRAEPQLVQTGGWEKKLGRTLWRAHRHCCAAAAKIDVQCPLGVERGGWLCSCFAAPSLCVVCCARTAVSRSPSKVSVGGGTYRLLVLVRVRVRVHVRENVCVCVFLEIQQCQALYLTAFCSSHVMQGRKPSASRGWKTAGGFFIQRRTDVGAMFWTCVGFFGLPWRRN